MFHGILQQQQQQQQQLCANFMLAGDASRISNQLKSLTSAPSIADLLLEIDAMTLMAWQALELTIRVNLISATARVEAEGCGLSPFRMLNSPAAVGEIAALVLTCYDSEPVDLQAVFISSKCIVHAL